MEKPTNLSQDTVASLEAAPGSNPGLPALEQQHELCQAQSGGLPGGTTSVGRQEVRLVSPFPLPSQLLCAHKCAYAHAHAHTHPHTCTHLYSYTHLDTYVHSHVYTHSHTGSMLTCVHTCSHTHTHPHACTLLHSPSPSTGSPSHPHTLIPSPCELVLRSSEPQDGSENKMLQMMKLE